MVIRSIPEALLNRACDLIGKEISSIPFRYKGIRITRKLVKAAMEILNAVPERTLAQRSLKAVKEKSPDGLDRRIKERLNSNLMTAPFISEVLAKVEIVDIVYVENPETGRIIKGTKLQRDWKW